MHLRVLDHVPTGAARGGCYITGSPPARRWEAVGRDDNGDLIWRSERVIATGVYILNEGELCVNEGTLREMARLVEFEDKGTNDKLRARLVELEAERDAAVAQAERDRAALNAVLAARPEIEPAVTAAVVAQALDRDLHGVNEPAGQPPEPVVEAVEDALAALAASADAGGQVEVQVAESEQPARVRRGGRRR